MRPTNFDHEELEREVLKELKKVLDKFNMEIVKAGDDNRNGVVLFKIVEK